MTHDLPAQELRGTLLIHDTTLRGWRVVGTLAGIKRSERASVEKRYRQSYAPQILHFQWETQTPPLHREAGI